MNKNKTIHIMGIVNLTDDSYFSDSRCVDVQAALERIDMLVREGADIIDLGACSTRPGSLPVGAEEEWHRLEPVLAALKGRMGNVRVSIDTYWASVVEKAYELFGPVIVNDISAGEDDPKMLPTVGRLGLTYIAMHKRGAPEVMQERTDYEDLMSDLVEYFQSFAEKARLHGIEDWILDPGFGFSKTIDQNYEMLRNLSCFNDVKTVSGDRVKLLVGVSRKSMIYKYFGITPQESLPATQVLHYIALCNGANVLRVHDVAEARRTVELFLKI